MADNPPNAVDDTATTLQDTVVTIPVLANDADPDGDTLSVSAVGPPTNGLILTQGINQFILSHRPAV